MADATLNGSGQLSGYLWQWQGGNSPATFALYRADANAFTTLATFDGFSLDPGDQLALRVIGDSVQGWVYHLGSWQQVASATDTTYRTGKIGVRPRGTTPIIDDFGGGPVQAPQQTTVSLTFDDAWSDQFVVPSMLASAGMHGTFYVNSGNIGTSPSFLGWNQLQSFQSAGNEIAGHTINHVDLTTVSLAEAQRQVCQDRRALLSEGLAVTDFAYPYGAYNTSTDSIVQGCGHNSGRRSWGLCSPAQTGCPAAETIPYQNLYEIRTQASIRSWTTVQDLENAVMNAEATGGWITFVFHHICDGCDSLCHHSEQPSSISRLAPAKERKRNGCKDRARRRRRVSAAGSVRCRPDPTDLFERVQRRHLLERLVRGTRQRQPLVCRLRHRCRRHPIHDGWLRPDRLQPHLLRAGLRRHDNHGQVSSLGQRREHRDNAVAADLDRHGGSDVFHHLQRRLHARPRRMPQPVTVALSASDSGGSSLAAIRYTTDGSDPTTSSTLYSGTFSISSTTTVKYRAWDNAGNLEATNSQLIQVDTTPADTTPPTSSIACNGSTCSSGWYTAPVSVSLSAVDSGGSGVAVIRYTTDGSDPSLSSSVYSAPFTVSSTTTVRYRAWDNAGNVEATKAQFIQTDTTAPQITLTSPVNGATVTGVVRLEATATDLGFGHWESRFLRRRKDRWHRHVGAVPGQLEYEEQQAGREGISHDLRHSGGPCGEFSSFDLHHRYGCLT